MISTFVEAKPRMSESAREVEDKEPLMAEFAPEVEGKQPLMTDFATDIEAEERPAPKQSRLKIALTILFHSTCAISSTLITKTALNSLDAPILLLALQFTVQVGLLTAIGVPMGYIKPLKPFTTWISLLPLALVRLTGILAKTYCLAAVDAAFYQVVRGLLLPFTLLLSLAILRPMPYFPPISLVGVCAVMMGFSAGLFNDFGRHLTGAKGIILGVGSSFTTAVESVVVKRYLNPKKDAAADSTTGPEREELGVWQMIWMSNILTLFIFFPLSYFSGDMATLATLVRRSASDAVAAATEETVHSHAAFLPLAFLTGFVGFLLTIATFMQINVTSPTTHMIVTATRGVAQSGLAVVFLKEAITVGRVTSMGFILGGSALYGWAKDRYTFGKDKAPPPIMLEQLTSVPPTMSKQPLVEEPVRNPVQLV